MECNVENNLRKCNCMYEPCSKKGKCCLCISYHRSNGELPACYFTAEEEKTYDRSTEFFVRKHK